MGKQERGWKIAFISTPLGFSLKWRATYGAWCQFSEVNMVVVQFLSRLQLFATPWTAAHQASQSLTISWSLLRFMFIEPVMPSNHLILCCPLPLLPSVFPITHWYISLFFSKSSLISQALSHWLFDWTKSTSVKKARETASCNFGKFL